jgi:anti-anti-sigma factor
MPLEIGSSVEGRIARLALSGELDGNSAPAVRQAVETALASAPEFLVLQVEQLTFMASAGLRILIFAKQKQPSVKIYLVKPQQPIVETLKKSGFYDAVYVTETEFGAEAKAS